MAEKIVVVVTKKPVEIKPGTVQPVEVKPQPSTSIAVTPGEKSPVNVLPSEKSITDLTVVAQQGPPGPPGPEGLRWRGTWDAATPYEKDDAVEYDGSAYIALEPSLGVPPPSNESKWDILVDVGTIDGGQW